MIYIHPFENSEGGAFDWHGGNASQYRWGALAVRLGRHFDLEYKGPWWDTDLEEIEEELVAHASDIMGEEVQLAPEYI